MSDVMLECRDVSIRYMVGDFKNIGLKEWLLRRLTGKYKVKEFWADCNVSFSLNRGDMLGIIGTNGAGKSTLLKAISGIMEPTRGKIIRRGRISALLELASGFDGDLTVKENAYLRGAMLGYTREFMDRTYPQILAFSELQEFEDRPFKQLSSGMKSRLAFAIASLVKPEILILDEVLSVGDGAFKAKSEAKMREIINGGVTTILVSHSIRQIQALCNKVLWLDHGRQVAFTDNVAYVCSCYERFLKAGVPVFVANDDADPDAASAPLVSVVMPVYNSGAYLREVVNSWLLQTFPGFELICVDDGSTDGSAEILGELKRDDSRICVVSQDHVGAAAARNRGLSLVNGEYVFFADSDDYVSSDLLEHMVAEARHTQAEIVVADHFVRRGTSERVVKLPNWLHELAMPISPAAEGMRILRAVGPMVWNKLFLVDHIRREGLVFKQHPLTDDLVFVFSAVCSAKRLSVAAGGYYHYRANRPGGQTASWCGVDGLSGLLDACMDLKEWMMRTGRSETYDYGFKQMLLGSMLHQLQAIDEKSFFDKAYCLFRKHALKEGLDELPVDLFGSAFEAKLFKLILDEPSSAAFCTAIVKAQNARENRLAKIDRALRLQQARIEGRLSDARLEVVSKTPLVSIPELPISSSASAYRSATVLGGLKQGEYYLFEADGTIVNSGGKVASLSIGLYEHQEGKTWIRYRVDRYRVYKKQNGMIRCVFKVPMVPGDWRLLVYAGRAGSTQGVSVSYHRVVVSKVAVRARLPVPVAVAEPPIGWAAYRSAVSNQIETALRLASARKEYHGLRSTLGADGVASEIGEVLFCDLKGVDK